MAAAWTLVATHGRDARATMGVCGYAALSFSGLRVGPNLLASAHANFVGHSAFGRATSRKLFRDDEAGPGASRTRRGVLFHRELPLDDVAVRRRGTPPKHAGGGA